MAAPRQATPRLGAARETSAGTLTATTAAAPLGGNVRCTEVLVQADPDNTNDVYFGDSANQTIHLKPGDPATVPVQNVNQVYVKTATGTAVVNWFLVYG